MVEVKTEYTVDGIHFDTKEAADKYAEDLNRQIKKREELEANQKSRAEEVRKAYDNYAELRNKYYEDYPLKRINWRDIFVDFFEED